MAGKMPPKPSMLTDEQKKRLKEAEMAGTGEYEELMQLIHSSYTALGRKRRMDTQKKKKK